MTAGAQLPPGVKFVRRDWLNANSILLRSPDCNILIDTGFVACVEETLQLLARPENLGADRLHRIINTHCHCDHMGGNAAVQSAYQCTVTVPIGEADFVRQWDGMGLWLDYAHHRAQKFELDDTLSPGDRFEGGGLEWLALGAPGHDMGALVFYCEQEKLLISGDALWEQSFGLVLPEPPEALAAARATLETIAALDIRWVLPGHGDMFSDVGAAVTRAFGRIAYFEQDPARLASHAIKAMFGFTLLDRGRLPLVSLSDLLQKVPASAQMNARYLHMGPDELVHWFVSQMEKAGIAFRQDGWLVSAGVR